MSTEDASNGTSPTPPLLGLLVSTTELVPPSPASLEMAGPLPVIVALVCIFFLLATFLIFVTLCKPAALDQSRSGLHECMPHHPADASEPQLRLWKRLGSLRCSINTFRRSRPVSQRQLACPKSSPASQDWDIMESTKM
uniref:Chromosome 10 open reading frame 105 n=1 Tax=Falco tinnunculus TaxID=100819 RepID=A0A8C4UDQ5_FALTI